MRFCNSPKIFRRAYFLINYGSHTFSPISSAKHCALIKLISFAVSLILGINPMSTLAVTYDDARSRLAPYVVTMVLSIFLLRQKLAPTSAIFLLRSSQGPVSGFNASLSDEPFI